MGHAVAVADAPASVFAAELIEAYPDAKIVLNYRSDIDAWHRSLISTLARGNQLWGFFVLSCLSKECFWSWHCYLRYMWPGLFRALDGNPETGMKRNAKWVYRRMCICPLIIVGLCLLNVLTEHYDMVRGMVPKERLLEWCVDDGWEPLCKFLEKPVPDEPFPIMNTGAGFAGQEQKLAMRWVGGAAKNLAFIVGTVAATVGAVLYTRRGS